MRERLVDLFRWVDPGPGSTHLVSDLSGWWRDGGVLAEIGPALATLARPSKPTVVLAPELSGTLLGPLVAAALGVGFVSAVKQRDGRLIAEPITWTRTAPDYRGRSLALGVRTRHLNPDDRVLVVDDWVATGGQLSALYDLVAARGADAVGAVAVVADCPPGIAARLRLHSLLTGGDLPA